MFRVSGTVRKGSKTVIYRHHFFIPMLPFSQSKTLPLATLDPEILVIETAFKQKMPRNIYKYLPNNHSYGNLT